MSRSPIFSREILGLEQTLGKAVHFHQCGRLDKAERLYQQILKRRPDHFDALHLLGVIRGQQGHNEEASRLIGRAIVVRPGSAEAHSNLGNILQALGRHEEAIASYDKSLAINRRNPNALNNRGNALQRLDRDAEALACYDAAIAIHSTFADAFYNRGNALKNLNRYQEAVASYDTAIAIRRSYPDAFYNRGKVLQGLRRLHDALASYDNALAIKPDHIEALHSRAIVLQELGRHDEALAGYDRALAIRPEDANALFNRAGVLQELGRHKEAVASYRRVLEIDSGHAQARPELLRLLLHLCDWPEASRLVPSLLGDIARGATRLHPLVLFYLPTAPAEHLACAQAYLKQLVPVLPKPLWSGRAQRGARIRLAYLSADFRNHVVGTVIGELLERHDRDRFEVFGVSFGPDDGSDLRRQLVSSFDRFLDVPYDSDEQVARLLHKLEIDIAVDLMGHTEYARPGILSWRPAPLQVSYLGYPGTTGAEFIDYLIADETVVPKEDQAFYSEKIVYLPDSYLIGDSRRMKLSRRIPSRSELRLPGHGVVFCGFGPSYKITAPVFDIWMRLLAGIEKSVLWLAQPSEVARANLCREAQVRGIDPARLVFAPKVPAIEDHLARQRQANLFLDTWPYNAHTTASHALWAGLPVLTCKGNTFAGRVGASVLRAAGLPELVAHTLEEYETRARELATNPALLHSIRSKLDENRPKCQLFDHRRLRRHIEAAYLTMWEKHRRGEGPQGFRVDPIEPMQTGS